VDDFGVVVGLSDHTLGSAVAIAAVAAGASIIEKHVTLSRADGGPDAAFSLEPEEFEALTEGCATAFDALGDATYARRACEIENIVFRRSIYIAQNIKKGELFTRDNIRVIRPGYGLAPKYLQDVLGQRALRDLIPGDPLDWLAVDKTEHP
jgi:N-acetylneuraminate synthase